MAQTAIPLCFIEGVAVESSLQSNIQLLVAALDLKLVSLITGAMRAVDNDATEQKILFGVPESPAARYEPRPVIHAQPKYETRPIIYERPIRFRPVEICDKPCTDFCPPTTPCAPELVVEHCAPFPIQPPWAVLPWPTDRTTTRSASVVKVLVQRPDNTSRGTILDRFL